MSTVRVFLSSTFSDFEKERLEVIEVFRRMRTIGSLDVDLITMEDFGFSDSPPLERCIELLASADAYLGFLGSRYGSMPPGGRRSYTEEEYLFAHERHMPIFLLEKTGKILASDIETDPSKLKLLQKLKEDARAKHLVVGFESVDELGKLLTQYLPVELRRFFPEERIALSNQDRLMVPFFRLGDRKSQLTQEKKGAATLEVLAISAIGFLRERTTIESYIREGCHIKILIVKRGGLAEQLIAANKGTSQLSNDLEQAVIRARDLSERTKASSGSIEVREIDWVPSASLFLFDSRLPGAIGWVGTYTPDLSTEAGAKWVVEVSRNHAGSALDFYATQFQQLWARGSPCW